MSRLLQRLGDFGRETANRPMVVYLILFFAGVLACALPTLRTGTVLPQEYDEFAYQLGAETFLHGRLANPPHPLAPFFETMHVLQRPTYASKYPPAQSMQLAVGMLLGHPIFGVWITVGLLGVATAWMLRGFAPATWAAAGGLVASLQWGALTYWGQSYWGGSLFALEGMLVFGGAVRFWRRPNIFAAGWAGIGAGAMALTRPYEGLWFCLVPAAAMVWKFFAWKVEKGKGKRKLYVALAAIVPVAKALTFLLAYNHAVTGDALKFPHQLYQQQNMSDVGVFVWDHPGPAPKDRNPEISYQLHRFNPEVMLEPTVNFSDLVQSHLTVALPRVGGFFFQGVLGLGALWALLGIAWRQSAGRLALACVAAFFLMLGTLRFFGFSHYAAAWGAPLAALILLGFEDLCAKHWGKWHLPVWVVALAVVGWTLITLGLETVRGNPPRLWAVSRMEVTQNLEEASAQDHHGHVVFVMMAEGQPAFAEWVYNGADIDGQTVIFARSLGVGRDGAVAHYYPERHLWQAWLKPDGQLDRLTPYDPPKTSPPPATKG